MATPAYVKQNPLTRKLVSAGKGKEVDSEDGFDDRDELMGVVDGVCSANRAARMSALARLASYLRLQCDEEDLEKYKSTLTNALFNCIRRGKCEERCRAATASALMAWVLGEAGSMFDKTQRYAERVLTTEIKHGEDYSEFVLAVAVIYFVESPDSYDTIALCQLLLRSAGHKKSNAHRAACVSAWTFLFSTVPPVELGGSAFVEAALQTMHEYLFDDNTGVRVAAGEAITMMYTRCNLGALSSVELAETGSEPATETDGLASILRKMTDIEKNMGEDNRKSKSDRSEQRRHFKEYLRVIDGEPPKSQRIVLPNGQTLEIQQYEDLIFLNALRSILRDGFLRSILTNRIMHSVLDFQPVEFSVERFNADDKTRREKQRVKDRRHKAAMA